MPGEVVYVRRDKLDALLSEIVDVADTAAGSTNIEGVPDLADACSGRLDRALAQFHAPHVPEVVLDPPPVQGDELMTVIPPKDRLPLDSGPPPKGASGPSPKGASPGSPWAIISEAVEANDPRTIPMHIMRGLVDHQIIRGFVDSDAEEAFAKRIVDAMTRAGLETKTDGSAVAVSRMIWEALLPELTYGMTMTGGGKPDVTDDVEHQAQAAGMSQAEAVVWEDIRTAARSSLLLIETDCQHSMERAEVCSAFHVLQRWVAARPFQRALLGLDGGPASGSSDG